MTSAAEVIMNFSTAAVSATSFEPTTFEPTPSVPMPSVLTSTFPTPFEPTSPPPGVVTEILTKGSHVDDGVFAALIAGEKRFLPPRSRQRSFPVIFSLSTFSSSAIAVSVLLLLVCIGVLLLWSSSRHKGSYATNETEGEEGEDEEEALQRTRVED
nr:uncharacterized protein LOC120825790 isoform X5 [Gasterosteus aculeatus aculeatus]XP_040043594.1 uncharacterized protein LOC120825790 isoform X5 [Gasterosteus aculeatus aculeatus]